MTYKNGARECLKFGMLSGLIMAAFLTFISQNPIFGVLVGFVWCVFYTFLMLIMIKLMEKNFSEVRAQMAKEKKIICDGSATVKGKGSWMFLSDAEILFCFHKSNHSNNKITISLIDIKSVATQKNKLIITLRTQTSVVAIVCRSKEWKRQIEEAIKRKIQKNDHIKIRPSIDILKKR